jgi:hypothetical protein
MGRREIHIVGYLKRNGRFVREEDNIKIDLKEVYERVFCIQLVEDSVQSTRLNTTMNEDGCLL